MSLSNNNKEVKLPGPACRQAEPGLPGNVISFHIVPLDPAHPAKAGRVTFRPKTSVFLLTIQCSQINIFDKTTNGGKESV